MIGLKRLLLSGVVVPVFLMTLPGLVLAQGLPGNQDGRQDQREQRQQQRPQRPAAPQPQRPAPQPRAQPQPQRPAPQPAPQRAQPPRPAAPAERMAPPRAQPPAQPMQPRVRQPQQPSAPAPERPSMQRPQPAQPAMPRVQQPQRPERPERPAVRPTPQQMQQPATRPGFPSQRPERPTPPAVQPGQVAPPAGLPGQRPGQRPDESRRPGQPVPPAVQPGQVAPPAGRPGQGPGQRPDESRRPGQPVPPAAQPGQIPALQPGQRPGEATRPGQPVPPPGARPGPDQNGRGGPDQGRPGGPDQRGQDQRGPDRREPGRGGIGAGGAAIGGAAIGAAGGFLAGEGLRRLDEVRENRRESNEDGRTYIREPGRTIIRDKDRMFVRHDENERFRNLNRDMRSERRGDDFVSFFPRPNGEQIVTLTDRDGRMIRRSRRFRDGREIIIIDNSFGPMGLPMADVVLLPLPVLTMPRERYILDADTADESMIYETLAAPPVAPLPRRYTLDQVRYSHDLRAHMRSVDLDTITFDTGSWEVTQGQAGQLENIAKALNQAISRNHNEVFLIEGYTDAVGNDVDNLSLSDRRAASVATILTQDFNVPPENLTTQGYGEEYLKVQTQEANRQNRRVTVRRITPLLNQNAQQ